MYYRYIDNKKEKDILLIHSFPSSSIIFEKRIPILSQTFNILLVDIPGFGLSNNLNFESPEITAESIINIILKLKISRLTIWGLSFGGIVGIYIAKDFQVENLIIESTPLSSKLIHTVELKALNRLESFLLKSRWLGKFQELTINSRPFRLLLILIYRLLNLGKKIYKEMSLESFISKLNMNSIFLVNKYLQNFDITDILLRLKNKVYAIYDLNDPVIYFNEMSDILKNSNIELHSYNFSEHCPSLVSGNTVANDVVALIG